jgi:uncharacterized membrane protein
MNKLLTPSNRPLWGLVTLLLALNTALIGWLVVAPSVAASQPHQGHHGAAKKHFLADTLQFSPEQLRQYNALRTQYLARVRPLTQVCRQECQRYFLLVDSAAMTDAQLTTRSRAALERKVAVDVCTARHLQQVAAMCTPAQRIILRRVLAPDCSENGCKMPEGKLGDSQCVQEM